MFLNLYNNCQTIRVIDGIEKFSLRHGKSPKLACEDNSTYSSLGGLKTTPLLRDLNGRNIFSSFKSIQTEIRENRISIETIREKAFKELVETFKEAINENLNISNLPISDNNFEKLVKFLLLNHPKEFTRFANNISSTRISKELIRDIESGVLNPDGQMTLYDYKRSLEILEQDNLGLIRELLSTIDPSLNEKYSISTQKIDGVEKTVIENKLTGEINILENSPLVEPDILEIAKDLYALLPEWDPGEDTATAIFDSKETTKEDIQEIIDFSKSEVEKGNLMTAQISIESVRYNVLLRKEIESLIKLIREKRQAPEIPGKTVVIDYTYPIPIGNKQLWIASGSDLNKLSKHKRYENDCFYIVGENISSECVQIPKDKATLAIRLTQNFNFSSLNNRSLLISYTGNQIKLDLSNMSFEKASNRRLISAHKALVGTRDTKGFIQEEISLHNSNIKLFKKLENLSEAIDRDLTGNDLREFILKLFEGPTPTFRILSMDGEAGREVREWNIKAATKLKEKTVEICTRDRDENGTLDTLEILKKDDFLKVIEEADLNDVSTCILLKTILRWNIDSYKEDLERECLFSYFDLFHEKLKSPVKTITGAEDEINIRLQKRMEEHMWKELPDTKFKIDSFFEEEHSVVVTQKDGIKEVIISPELAYPIVLGKTSLFSTRYYDAIDTVMCYL